MADDPLLGKQVGNYVVTGLLGRGGMGEVYVAEHPEIGRKVAIKVLAHDLLTTRQLAARFRAEAQAITRIGHPNVVQVFDFGTLADGRLYYMMELLQGCDLKKVMETRGKMSAREVEPFLAQICAGLDAAHRHGVIHRDLKPENVFVVEGDRFEVKLLDFGIAKVLERQQGSGLTSSGFVVGTPLFIAPEQALGQPDRISPRTDLYALGVLLYWMLAGRPPFESEIVAELLTMHLRETAPPLCAVEPSIPPGVAAVVERCLEKDPLRRFASAPEVARAFADALAGSPSVARPATSPGAGTVPLRPTVPYLAARPSPQAPAAPVRHGTTMSASAGEMTRPAGRDESYTLERQSVWKWISAGAVAFAITGGAVAWLLRQPRTEQGYVPRPVAGLAGRSTSTDAAPRASPAGSPPVPVVARRHVVLVHTGDPRATCRVVVEGDPPQKLKLPCRFEVSTGKHVRLEVLWPGAAPRIEEWTASADRTVEIAPAGTSSRPTAPGTSKHVRPIRPTVATPSAPVPGPGPPPPATQPRRAPVGEGTMEME
jgi:serine/threonine-protein kinase